jgi:hypothetical protein
MIHRIPRLIHYISTFTSLEPGDVIVTHRVESELRARTAQPGAPASGN